MQLKKVQVWIHCRGLVLLLKTTPERGGFWQPVTGSVEPGEWPDRAALREAREETGLNFSNQPAPLHYRFHFLRKDGSSVNEEVFALEISSESFEPPSIRLDSREHVEARWLQPQEAFGYLKFESNTEGLRQLIKFLKLPLTES